MITSLKTGVNGGSVADGVQTWSRGELYPWHHVVVEDLPGNGWQYWQHPDGRYAGYTTYTVDTKAGAYDLCLQRANEDIALDECLFLLGGPGDSADLEYDNPANWLCYDSSENVA